MSALEQSLLRAGENRLEIEKVLAHYRQNPADSLKLKAAILLISNMENNLYYTGDWLTQYDSIFNQTAFLSAEAIATLKDVTQKRIGRPNQATLTKIYDLEKLTSQYLIENIDLAFNTWEKAPWKESVSFNVFCNFILPYKTFNESPERWRTLLQKRYAHLLVKQNTDSALFRICEGINNDMASWFHYGEIYADFQGSVSISNILKGKTGDCNEIANFSGSSARALGIPVAVDHVIQYGNGYSGHTFNALILTDKKFAAFWGAESTCFDFLPYMKIRWERKIPKVYRRMLAPTDSSFATLAANNGISDIPRQLKNSRYLDVTDYYTSTTNVTLPFDVSDGTPVYLCVYQSSYWVAVVGSFVMNGKATFQKVGTNILYLPMFYEDGEYDVARNPMLLHHNKSHQEIKPNDAQTQVMVLHRKCPLRRKQVSWHWNKYLVKCRFEASNSPDFKDVVTLHTVGKPIKDWQIGDAGGVIARDRLEYKTLWQEVIVASKEKYRYIRIVSRRDTLKIGDLAFFESNTAMPIKGKIIGTVANAEWAFDGAIGHSLIDETPGKSTKWVGLDLGTPTAIHKISYLPPNDKNTILPGKKYELFYWNDKWVSLGIKKADSFVLSYGKAPKNALYWLQCLNCQGTEERPFTYENGKQIWW